MNRGSIQDYHSFISCDLLPVCAKLGNPGDQLRDLPTASWSGGCPRGRYAIRLAIDMRHDNAVSVENAYPLGIGSTDRVWESDAIVFGSLSDARRLGPMIPIDCYPELHAKVELEGELSLLRQIKKGAAHPRSLRQGAMSCPSGTRIILWTRSRRCIVSLMSVLRLWWRAASSRPRDAARHSRSLRQDHLGSGRRWRVGSGSAEANCAR